MDFFLRTGEYRFFEKYFDSYNLDDSSPDAGYIKFEHFQAICYESEKFNKSLLPSFMEKIKRLCRDKLRKKDEEILINRQEFFTYIEIVVRENDKTENERDPELKELFDLLKDKELEIIVKKRLVEIIHSFDIPLNIDDFLGSLKKKDELDFNDFCSLFKKKTDSSSMVFSTFYSSFYNTKDLIKQDYKDSFPIKLNIREELELDD